MGPKISILDIRPKLISGSETVLHLKGHSFSDKTDYMVCKYLYEGKNEALRLQPTDFSGILKLLKKTLYANVCAPVDTYIDHTSVKELPNPIIHNHDDRNIFALLVVKKSWMRGSDSQHVQGGPLPVTNEVIVITYNYNPNQ